jgi:dynein heavy chain
MKFNPVLDMYNLLDSYLPGGIIDKDELDARLMLKSNWENLMIYADVK